MVSSYNRHDHDTVGNECNMLEIIQCHEECMLDEVKNFLSCGKSYILTATCRTELKTLCVLCLKKCSLFANPLW